MDSTSQFGEALLSTIVPTALGGSAELDQNEDGSRSYEIRIPAAQFF
jgi:hypothetical protein